MKLIRMDRLNFVLFPMIMMRLKDWQDYQGNACHVEGS